MEKGYKKKAIVRNMIIDYDDGYDDYCLITDANQLRSTGYMEFFPGKYTGKRKPWSDKSAFIYESAVDFIYDLFVKANKEYDHYGYTYFNNDQINILIDGLSKRLGEINYGHYTITVEVHYSEEDITQIFEMPKDKIIKMLEDLIAWISANREDGISVLGI